MKITYEIAKERFQEKGFILLTKEYLKNNVKMDCCDSEGYQYQISLMNLSSGRIPEKFNKFNAFVLENIQLYLNLQGTGTKILSDTFTGSKDLLKWQCSCGNIYFAKWEDVYTRSRLFCSECVKKNNTKRLEHKHIETKFLECGLVFEDGEIYKNNEEKIKCINEDGYKVAISWANLQFGKKPYVFSLRYNLNNYIFNVNQYFKLNNIECKALKILNKSSVVWIECQCSCGEIFQTNIDSIRNQDQYRCLNCSSYMSTLELKVKNYLLVNNVEFVFQKRFDGCKMKRALPFDFYLPKYNMCIEVDGEQHFKPVPFGGANVAQSNFEKVKKSDKIKTTFCKEHNIYLLRISYKDFRTNKYITTLKNNIH